MRNQAEDLPLKSTEIQTYNKNNISKWAEESVPVGLVFDMEKSGNLAVYFGTNILGYLGWSKKKKKLCMVKFPEKHSLDDMYESYANYYHKKILKEKKKKLNSMVGEND